MRALSSHIRFSLRVLGIAWILTAMILRLLNSCPWQSYPENYHLRNGEPQSPFPESHLRTRTVIARTSFMPSESN